MMRQENTWNNGSGIKFNYSVPHSLKQKKVFEGPASKLAGLIGDIPNPIKVGVIIIFSLLLFEVLNFSATKYALTDLLGEASFMGFRWATILAIAFCSIDFVCLAYFFAPERLSEARHETWYLIGAWLLAASANAVMTWWAVSLSLLNSDFGSSILNQGQLLSYVPLVVAALVWLTRLIFIGAFTIAGNQLFWVFGQNQRKRASVDRKPASSQIQVPIRPFIPNIKVELPHISDDIPDFLQQKTGQDNPPWGAILNEKPDLREDEVLIRNGPRMRQTRPQYAAGRRARRL